MGVLMAPSTLCFNLIYKAKLRECTDIKTFLLLVGKQAPFELDSRSAPQSPVNCSSLLTSHSSWLCLVPSFSYFCGHPCPGSAPCTTPTLIISFSDCCFWLLATVEASRRRGLICMEHLLGASVGLGAFHRPPHGAGEKQRLWDLRPFPLLWQRVGWYWSWAEVRRGNGWAGDGVEFSWRAVRVPHWKAMTCAQHSSQDTSLCFKKTNCLANVCKKHLAKGTSWGCLQVSGKAMEVVECGRISSCLFIWVLWRTRLWVLGYLCV